MTDARLLAETQTPLEREFRQKRNGNHTRLKFGKDELDYAVIEKNGSSSFRVRYADIGRNRDFFIERNTWLQNVGVLWMVIGVVVIAINVAADRSPWSIWLPLGIGCWLWAHFRTTRYSKIVTGAGTLYIIDDAQKDAILKELEDRRLNQLRRWYDFLSQDEDLPRQRARYQWLYDEGALSESELEQRLGALELQFAGEPAAPASVESSFVEDASPRRLLN